MWRCWVGQGRPALSPSRSDWRLGAVADDPGPGPSRDSEATGGLSQVQGRASAASSAGSAERTPKTRSRHGLWRQAADTAPPPLRAGPLRTGPARPGPDASMIRLIRVRPSGGGASGGRGVVRGMPGPEPILA
jgi:hypothetical protein